MAFGEIDKVFLCALTAALLASASCGATACGVYDDVLPALRKVTPQSGEVGAASLAAARFVRGTVAGAPERVASQAYSIEISRDGVVVTAGGDAGERYARTTLRQLAKLSGGGPVPAAKVVDWPELEWRGVMNDCGRNYLAMEGVKAFIDLASEYKMNIFHWHLSDYHGWRLESKLYPELVHPDTMTRQVGKFYSQDEFREIVAYAKERGVVVMPELDVPGHTLALRRGLGVKEMRHPSVRKAVADLLGELCSLASAEDMPFVHIGTDEVRVEQEYVPDGWCSEWAEAVAAKGRACVVWAPGKTVRTTGEVVDMAWYRNHVTNSNNRAFDAAGMYFAGQGPELVLNLAAFSKPCDWNVGDARKLGAIACCWHDDNVGDDTLRLFANATVAPAILGFADNFWAGRAELGGDASFKWRTMLPPEGSRELEVARALERRIIAQRDRVLADFKLPFPYLRQTDQHWRLRRADGSTIDADAVGGLVDVMARVADKSGEVVAETWVKSPKTMTAGAWIGFTVTGGVYSRQHDQPMPGIGQWNKYGSYVEVNGKRIEPPVWTHPGARVKAKPDPDGKSFRGAVYSNDLSETPLEDEWYYIREPTKVDLRAGWNHVRLVLRKPKNIWGRSWRGTFRLLEGTSDHPREVPGLVWSAEPGPGL
ncbi:MAG: family 20 glycosylhydrolase [Kiritimatiellae bacterium]|nr:family 20 glycosylhydrolase [Kiritimatiellia bacterium]